MDLSVEIGTQNDCFACVSFRASACLHALRVHRTTFIKRKGGISKGPKTNAPAFFLSVTQFLLSLLRGFKGLVNPGLVHLCLQEFHHGFL